MAGHNFILHGISMFKVIYSYRYSLLIDKRSDDVTVNSLNSLEIAILCCKQNQWRTADDRMLITTIRDLRLDLDSCSRTLICKKWFVSISVIRKVEECFMI